MATERKYHRIKVEAGRFNASLVACPLRNLHRKCNLSDEVSECRHGDQSRETPANCPLRGDGVRIMVKDLVTGEQVEPPVEV